MTPELGWVALLDKQLDEMSCPYEVVNASISGETTVGGLTRLPRLIATHKPTIIIIELGSNDGLRGFPIREIHDNLQQMIALSQAGGARVVVLGMRIPSNYGQRYTQAFAGTFSEVAEKNSTGLLGFFLEGISEDKNLMQADTIHPNAAAQPLLRDRVMVIAGPLLGCAETAP